MILFYFKYYLYNIFKNVVKRLYSGISPYPAFQCHENGATVLQYAPKQQLIITGGRKGFVCIFDIRQRQLLHTFQAHDSAIKALAMDSTEDVFVTGSAEGNMKVYSSKVTQFILNIS